VGYIAVNPAEMNDLIKIQDTMLICAPHIGQRAALIGMRSCAEETAEFVARCEEKCARFRREMTASPVARLVSAGAIFAWIHVPIPAPSAMERTLLFYERTGLLGLPGDVFGASQSEYIRLALSNVEGEDVLEAARRCCQMSGA
jgi:aspartate/methionine/tyrosine aminotransferase